MNRIICLFMIVVLMVTCVLGCNAEDDNVNKLNSIGVWYRQVMSNMDYHGFISNYGKIITQEEFQDLQKLHQTNRTESSEVCMIHTYKDGTRELLILQPVDAEYLEFKIVDIQILPKD